MDTASDRPHQSREHLLAQSGAHQLPQTLRHLVGNRSGVQLGSQVGRLAPDGGHDVGGGDVGRDSEHRVGWHGERPVVEPHPGGLTHRRLDDQTEFGGQLAGVGATSRPPLGSDVVGDPSQL